MVEPKGQQFMFQPSLKLGHSHVTQFSESDILRHTLHRQIKSQRHKGGTVEFHFIDSSSSTIQDPGADVVSSMKWQWQHVSVSYFPFPRVAAAGPKRTWPCGTLLLLLLLFLLLILTAQSSFVSSFDFGSLVSPVILEIIQNNFNILLLNLERLCLCYLASIFINECCF